MKRIWMILIAILAAAGAGCTSVRHYELTQQDSGRTLNLNTGDTITVKLKENATTGYMWRAALPWAPDMLVQTADRLDTVPGTNPDLCGAPRMKVMEFKAIGPGSTGIKLEYVRPWEKNAKAAKRFDLLLMIQGKAEANGKPLFDEPQDGNSPRVGSKGQVEPPVKGLFE